MNHRQLAWLPWVHRFQFLTHGTAVDFPHIHAPPLPPLFANPQDFDKALSGLKLELRPYQKNALKAIMNVSHPLP